MLWDPDGADERARIDLVALDGLAKQLLRESTVLVSRDHPCHDVATVEVKYDVEVQKDAALVGGELADISGADQVSREGRFPAPDRSERR